MVSKGVEAMQIIGYIFAFGEAFAPVCTFLRIRAQNDVGPNTCFPYWLLWLNAVVLTFQAAWNDDWVTAGVYIAIAVITMVYCGIYVWYSKGGNRRLACAIGALLLAFLGGMLIVYFTIYKNEQDPDVVKLAFDELVFFVTIFTYVSPGIEVYVAYTTDQVGGVDLLLSFAFLGNAVVSVIAACLPFDVFPLLGGVVGIFCSGGQIAVWIRCYLLGHQHNPLNIMEGFIKLVGLPP